MASTSSTGKKPGTSATKKTASGSQTAAKKSSAASGSKKTASAADTKKKSTGKSSQSAQTSRSTKGKQEVQQPVGDPLRLRSMKIFLCLALALFSLIGCFTEKGWFISFFRSFMQGLIGKGFFFLPAALALCALYLASVRTKPVSSRIFCTLLMTVVLGALIHLFGCSTEFAWTWKLPGELYDAGVLQGAAGSGGVLGGFLAELFEQLFNRVGAGILLALAALFLVLGALDITLATVVERSKEKQDRRKEEWARVQAAERELAMERIAAAREQTFQEAERIMAASPQPQPEQMPQHPVFSEPVKKTKKKSVIDVPMDEGPHRPAAEGEYFDAPRTARSESGKKPAAAAAPAAGAAESRTESKPSEKDWLAEILTKDRLGGSAPKSEPKPEPKPERVRSSAVSSREIRPVETAIRPTQTAIYPAGSGQETGPAAVPMGTEEEIAAVVAESLLEESLKQPEAPIVAEAPRPMETPRAADMPEAPAARPSAPLREGSTVTAEEAAAALAEEKLNRAVEKAETIKAKAEMVANIEESLADQAQAAPVQYIHPPLSLLASGSGSSGDEGREEPATNARRPSATIKSFGIPATIRDVTRGPTVTRYEIELEQGVRLSRLTNLADDIALALGVVGVRIAPVPDKVSIVGVEVPNKSTTTVYLRDILDTPAFREKTSPLVFAVGKDIGGTPIVGDIDKLTHLLIAGTTGSGKSVCMNSLILSLLYKSSPEEVRLIMVDPKMIELGIYNGIPHLLIPVVTDPKKAAGALQWAVMEMLKRYRLIADSGMRDLTTYNRYAERTEGCQKMPRLVILIDELADLMLVAAKDVEESICRIAQMGRAAGIHLVIATQRPSADVITGLMKANIPSRIAFSVDSALNSRIILDATGAEKLVGKGDMLFSGGGATKNLRVQGTFVTDAEREEVINFVKEQGLASYAREVEDEIERGMEKDKGKDKSASSAAAQAEEAAEDSGLDDMFDDAVEAVLDSKQASVSMLQRRLKLGYSRAARIVDQMEERGIVGPFEGSKPRAVLITREQWNAQKGIGSPVQDFEPEAFLPEEAEGDPGVPEDF